MGTESFEIEFKNELTQSHPIVYKWKIQKLYALHKRYCAVSVSHEDDSLEYFDELRNHSKFYFVRLSIFKNDFKRAKNLLEKIPLDQLPFLKFCEWCKIPIFIRQKSCGCAEELLNRL